MAQTRSACWKWVVSTLLCFHLIAISIAPLAISPTSPLIRTIYGFFDPYLATLYLDHGYHYFAPEPGPSHRIRCELTFSDGAQETIWYPDAELHAPRLLYHRYFMLSEHLAGLYESAESVHSRNLSRSYASQILKATRAEQVRLTLVRHQLITPEALLEGIRISDPSLDYEFEIGSFDRNGPLEHDQDLISNDSETLPSPVVLLPVDQVRR